MLVVTTYVRLDVQSSRNAHIMNSTTMAGLLPTTPPHRNAATSLSFTPYILKTASVPTSAIIYQATPLNQDLQNELAGATIDEPKWTKKGSSHYVLHLYQQFQQHTGVQDPKLSELESDPPLYDSEQNCWQPSLLPNILRHSPSTTTHGKNDSLFATNPRPRKLTVTRTVKGSSATFVETEEGTYIRTGTEETKTREAEGSTSTTFVETEEGTYLPTAGTEETKIASWLNCATTAMSHLAPSSGHAHTRSKTITDARRVWSAEFATKPAPTDSDFNIKMKPDIALLQKDPFDPSGPNSWRDVVSFLEFSSNNDWSNLSKQLLRKAYAIFVAQPGRRFVIALSIVRSHFRLHIFDRAGVIHSRPYSIHLRADFLIRVLYLLAFAPKDFIGCDPTIFYSSVITRSNQLRCPATIQVGKETFIITDRIFSSDMMRGRATLCFAVKTSVGRVKDYVVKDSWAREGRATNEEEMLMRIKERGLTVGVTTLVTAWTVQIRGIDDSTTLRRPDDLLRDISQGQQPEIRIHRRLLLEPVGKPLHQFTCITELISIFIDIVDGTYPICYSSRVY